MNHMRTLPVPGEFYRHFKNRLYQIVAIAYHSETNEAMVVYQALYGEYRIWVRPLSMFMEEVDRNKYPEVEPPFVNCSYLVMNDQGKYTVLDWTCVDSECVDSTTRWWDVEHQWSDPKFNVVKFRVVPED